MRAAPERESETGYEGPRWRAWLRGVAATARGRTYLLFAGALAFALLHHLLGAVHAPYDHFALKGAPWSDAQAYHLAALDWLDGYGLRENQAFPTLLRALRAPGYVLFVALVYAWGFGAEGLALLQLGLHAATCALVYRIGARTFGERAGLFAGIALALSRTSIDFASLVMTETLSVALLVFAVWAVVRPRARPEIAGLLIGIAATMRPVALVAAPLLALYVYRRGPMVRRPLLWGLGLALLPLMLWSARNRLVVGVFSPAATCHVWTTWSEFVPPEPDSNNQNYAAFVPLLDRSEAEQQETFRYAFMASVFGQPLRYLRRVYHLWESNLRLPVPQPLDAPGLLLLPLLLLTAWGCTRALDRPAVLLLAAWAVFFLLATAFLGESSGRFRVAVDWALTLLVCGGLSCVLGIEGETLAEPEPWRWQPPAKLALVLGCGVLAALPMIRILRAPPLERIELDAVALGARRLSFDEYVQAVFRAPKEIEGQTVAWAGVIDTVTHFAPAHGDARSEVTSPRPYGRTLALFQVDGVRGPLDGRRVFLEIPDELGWPAPARCRAVVTARIETNLRNASRERARLVATAIRKL